VFLLFGFFKDGRTLFRLSVVRVELPKRMSRLLSLSEFIFFTYFHYVVLFIFKMTPVMTMVGFTNEMTANIMLEALGKGVTLVCGSGGCADTVLGWCIYFTLGKVKVKVTLRHTVKVQRGSDGLLCNLGARWGGWSTPRPGRFTFGKETPYPLYRRLGGPQDGFGLVRKTSAPPGFASWTVSP
jgi:hypothetical protein